MTLASLLVCVDGAAAEVLRRVLNELNIKVEACPDVARATIRLAQDRFDVVIIDCDSQAEVTTLLRETRLSRLNDSTLAVAVVHGQENIREMFSLGVNFVLYKPVSYERALSSLRAARAVMRKEKRKNTRAAVHTHATIDYANVSQEKATLVDLGEDGMAVQFGKKLPPVSKVYFQFRLPGQAAAVRLSGQVVWQDWNGRAGIQFADVPKTSRKLLSEFLSTARPANALQEPPSSSAIEIDVPLEAAHVAVTVDNTAPERRTGDRRRETRIGETKIVQSDTGETETIEHEVEKTSVETKREEPTHGANAAAAARLRSEHDNRRGRARYACRLGAEVYRTGVPVPNHCCLTDLSAGGCYLEVALPFPQGSAVEIIVRTYDMKLQLRGKVQASHPGYGMGIEFELKTKEEREQVQKLTDFVAASSNPV